MPIGADYKINTKASKPNITTALGNRSIDSGSVQILTALSIKRETGYVINISSSHAIIIDLHLHNNYSICRRSIISLDSEVLPYHRI